jgi:hypothetical protein
MKETITLMETILSDRDLVINDLSAKLDNLNDELRHKDAINAASKQAETTAIVESDSLRMQISSLTESLRLATKETPPAPDENELRVAKAQIQK